MGAIPDDDPHHGIKLGRREDKRSSSPFMSFTSILEIVEHIEVLRERMLRAEIRADRAEEAAEHLRRRVSQVEVKVGLDEHRDVVGR